MRADGGASGLITNWSLPSARQIKGVPFPMRKLCPIINLKDVLKLRPA